MNVGVLYNIGEYGWEPRSVECPIKGKYYGGILCTVDGTPHNGWDTSSEVHLSCIRIYFSSDVCPVCNGKGEIYLD